MMEQSHTRSVEQLNTCELPDETQKYLRTDGSVSYKKLYLKRSSQNYY